MRLLFVFFPRRLSSLATSHSPKKVAENSSGNPPRSVPYSHVARCGLERVGAASHSDVDSGETGDVGVGLFLALHDFSRPGPRKRTAQHPCSAGVEETSRCSLPHRVGWPDDRSNCGSQESRPNRRRDTNAESIPGSAIRWGRAWPQISSKKKLAASSSRTPPALALEMFCGPERESRTSSCATFGSGGRAPTSFLFGLPDSARCNRR